MHELDRELKGNLMRKPAMLGPGLAGLRWRSGITSSCGKFGIGGKICRAIARSGSWCVSNCRGAQAIRCEEPGRVVQLARAGTWSSGIGFTRKSRRVGLAMVRATQFALRALSVEMPVLAYIWR